MLVRLLSLFTLLSLAAGAVAAQGNEPSVNPALRTSQWRARWITAPGAEPFGFGVYHFRRSFDLAEVPPSFTVHVTADNRYQLWVNGVRVARGPARGDLQHWRYETLDLAPHLKPGRNVLAAVVWNYAQLAPEAQVWNQTGFLMQGDREPEQVVNTGSTWKVLTSTAYQPIQYTSGQMRGYYVVGPGDRIDGASYPWGWETVEFDESAFRPALAFSPGSPREAVDGPNRWMLVPRPIPLMEESPERLSRVRITEGVTAPEGFPREVRPVTIPARTRARLLLDQDHLTTAYPEILVSGGRGATVSAGYAEALYNPGGARGDKGDRDAVEGKEFIGNRDIFLPDGGRQRLFSPLWWRTYRYLDLAIQTADEPLVIEDVRGIFTGYPFEMRATWQSDRPMLQKVLDIGWRTARLCAYETYVDCPYYEQLQYVGDTRIQCMVSLYNSGDSRLMRNAIEQLDNSRGSDGATMSRYPTRQQQYIPSFSLWWIGMVHDYWRYVDDPEFARTRLPGIRSVLDFFRARQQENGSLGPLPWWNYVDWARDWPRGTPPSGAGGSSAPIDLQLVLAYDWAADLEQALGSKSRAAECRAAARSLRKSARSLYWNPTRGLFADTPGGSRFSQQTNSLAVLAGLTQGDEARSVVERTLADDSLTQASYYFQYYLHAAVKQVGLGDRYLSLLGDWEKMIQLNMTTWAERLEGGVSASRSDCHAWSAHPNVELYRIVLGIDTAAPAFGRVEIRPNLGPLQHASGSIPHPRGQVHVSLKREAAGVRAEVVLPPGVPGELQWKGIKHPLRPGLNELSLPPG